MWELDFAVVEEARAKRHGRTVVRREERMRSDEAVSVTSGGREVARGFCLDRSANGARVVLAGADDHAVGRNVVMTIGEDTFVFRVVWAYVQGTACVLGLERDRLMESGAFPTLAAADPTLISRAA